MTEPERKPQDESPDEDSKESTSRPDWLVGMDQDLGLAPKADPSRRRGPGPPPPLKFVPPPSQGAAAQAPKAAPTPVASTPFDFSGHGDRTASAGGNDASPAPARSERREDAAAAGRAAAGGGGPAPEDETPGAWSAAASSVPALRSARKREVPEEQELGPEWDDPRREPDPKAVIAARSPSGPAARYAVPLRVALGALERISRSPRILMAAGVLVLVFTGIGWVLSPHEHFTSLAKIHAKARQLDGLDVHIKGTVGQVFQVGQGYAFYLHQGRDTIVVFTSLRVPVERAHIHLVGTVSTGFLDGTPRPAVFESGS